MDDKIVLRFIQISDLHISSYRDLLEPMVDQINNEVVDLVVVTGDTVQSPTKELFDKASKSLDKIKHRVIAVPGDYDGSELWTTYFGERKKSIVLNGYCLDFLDTAFLRHRFAVGWGDVMKAEDPEQYNWLWEKLKVDKYHIIFSHHPFGVDASEVKHEMLTDNVRALYAGHLHEPKRLYFKYEKPRSNFQSGFSSVPLKFHGNSCYLTVLIKANGEMVNIPKVVGAKKTAW